MISAGPKQVWPNKSSSRGPTGRAYTAVRRVGIQPSELIRAVDEEIARLERAAAVEQGGWWQAVTGLFRRYCTPRPGAGSGLPARRGSWPLEGHAGPGRQPNRQLWLRPNGGQTDAQSGKERAGPGR